MKTSMSFTLACTFLLPMISICGEEKRASCRPEEIFSFTQGYPVEDALFFVKLGSYCRENDKLEEAESYLCKALEQDPDFSQAYTELGLLCLQRKEFRQAKEYFYRSLQIAPCDPGAMEGLEKVALEWEKEKCTQRCALEIYHDLLCCDPENPNFLFRIGRLYAWLDDRRCGEHYLLCALKNDPDFSDAEIQLGLLYFWEKRWREAEMTLCKFPESQAAQEARAKIFLSSRCYREALEVLTPLLCKEDKEFGFNTLYAQTLMLLRRYYDSERFHRLAVCEDPCNEKSWNHLFYVKKYTHPTLYLDANYIEAKEDEQLLIKLR
ncbi:MAG: hypothetical protein KR126chlam2_00432 [Chlamydiae bacterium]|nr:hypothetical protein [Chlamydiota bacterium]